MKGEFYVQRLSIAVSQYMTTSPVADKKIFRPIGQTSRRHHNVNYSKSLLRESAHHYQVRNHHTNISIVNETYQFCMC